MANFMRNAYYKNNLCKSIPLGNYKSIINSKPISLSLNNSIEDFNSYTLLANNDYFNIFLKDNRIYNLIESKDKFIMKEINNQEGLTFNENSKIILGNNLLEINNKFYRINSTYSLELISNLNIISGYEKDTSSKNFFYNSSDNSITYSNSDFIVNFSGNIFNNNEYYSLIIPVRLGFILKDSNNYYFIDNEDNTYILNFNNFNENIKDIFFINSNSFYIFTTSNNLYYYNGIKLINLKFSYNDNNINTISKFYSYYNNRDFYLFINSDINFFSINDINIIEENHSNNIISSMKFNNKSVDMKEIGIETNDCFYFNEFTPNINGELLTEVTININNQDYIYNYYDTDSSLNYKDCTYYKYITLYNDEIKDVNKIEIYKFDKINNKYKTIYKNGNLNLSSLIDNANLSYILNSNIEIIKPTINISNIEFDLYNIILFNNDKIVGVYENILGLDLSDQINVEIIKTKTKSNSENEEIVKTDEIILAPFTDNEGEIVNTNINIKIKIN